MNEKYILLLIFNKIRGLGGERNFGEWEEGANKLKMVEKFGNCPPHLKLETGE